MITLPNGCSCSNITVNPKNWDKPGASIKKDWYIQYYFYDPNFKEQYPHGKLKITKGMNQFQTLEERKYVTRQIIAAQWVLLKDEGYNHITGECIPPVLVNYEIETTTPILIALEIAVSKLKMSTETIRNINSALKYIRKSIINLGYDKISVEKFTRKYASLVLNNCYKIKKDFSGHSFNHYRSYLQILFNKLIEMEAAVNNPIDKHIPKVDIVSKLRVLLTPEECSDILNFYKENDRFYYRFIHIFFHSGTRPIELLKLKPGDIDLEKRIFKVTVKKGNKIREEERPIKTVALEYWKELIEESKPDFFIFGFKLQPSDRSCTRDYITKKWQRDIKGVREKKSKSGLNISKDLYSLKHKNLDEIAAYLSVRDAQKAAGHQSPVITMQYVVNERERANKRIQEVPNILGR